eukprot:SAG22_NODE_2325_length_2711_cov_2.227795_1_plen_148_part_00
MVTDKYRWMQTLADVTICVQLPAGTQPGTVSVSVTTNTLDVSIQGVEAALVAGFFHAAVKTEDDVTWSIDDAQELTIMLVKINDVRPAGGGREREREERDESGGGVGRGGGGSRGWRNASAAAVCLSPAAPHTVCSVCRDPQYANTI